MTNRRAFLKSCGVVGISTAMAEALWHQAVAAQPATGLPGALPAVTGATTALPITREMVRAVEAVTGLSFTDAERDLMLASLEYNLAAYQNIRLVPISNAVLPAVQFSPVLPGRTFPVSWRTPLERPHSRPQVKLPPRPDDLAFMSVMELAELLRTGELTSMALTAVYLDRLKRFNPQLKCVVTLTEELALEQARAADRRQAAGHRLGPLDGIPYGVKDCLAVPGYPTTWGAGIYRDRIIDQTATVVERLTQAGAVLVAKLSMGELGLNDTWFGGTTVNPWHTDQGASGSSAGSAAATAAGLVGFGIGMETMGSIIRPATRNGVTGLRPTFGRVSRSGSMIVAWSLDKIGPLARSVEDCAVILEVIAGADGEDPTAVPIPFQWTPDRRLGQLRVGYFKAAFDAPHTSKALDDAALVALRALGVTPVPIDLPTDLPVNSLLIVRVEAAAAFDEFVRSGAIHSLVEQGEAGWPNFVRSGHLVPAVEYLQANRIRTMLMERLEAVFEEVDVFISPTYAVMPVTNLTGHPTLVVPNGMTPDGIPSSISFVGRLFGEAPLATVAKAWQDSTDWHLRHPERFR